MGDRPLPPPSDCRCSGTDPTPNGREHVSVSRNKSNLGRAVAAGLSAALMAALALVGAAPAAAAPDFTYPQSDVFAADISTEPTTTGWHQSSPSVNIGGSGLVLDGAASLTYEFSGDSLRLTEWNLLNEIGQGLVTWDTTAGSDAANFEIRLGFGAGPSFTTLSSTAAVAGANVAAADQIWRTSAAIGSAYASGDTAELQALIHAAVAEGNAKTYAFGVRGTGAQTVVSTIGWDYIGYKFLAGERLTPGTVTFSGTPALGHTLTAVPAGWPADTTFSYVWSFGQGQSGSGIDNTASSYTLTEAQVGSYVTVTVIGSKAGFGDARASVTSALVTAPKKAAVSAPVGDSAGLPAFLAANGSTPVDQVSTGLPAGPIDPGKAHTAEVDWFGGDSYVDVYAYSSPVFVGTFPVVNGVVQITLSTAVLGQLAAGNHTLVVIGQSSGSVQSVSLALGLTATGADFTVPVTVASSLLLVGAGLMFARRRLAARA